jgi:hypothetical protein
VVLVAGAAEIEEAADAAGSQNRRSPVFAGGQQKESGPGRKFLTEGRAGNAEGASSLFFIGGIG